MSLARGLCPREPTLSTRLSVDLRMLPSSFTQPHSNLTPRNGLSSASRSDRAWALRFDFVAPASIDLVARRDSGGDGAECLDSDVEDLGVLLVRLRIKVGGVVLATMDTATSTS